MDIPATRYHLGSVSKWHHQPGIEVFVLVCFRGTWVSRQEVHCSDVPRVSGPRLLSPHGSFSALALSRL